MFEVLKQLSCYERRFFVIMTISSITNSFPMLTYLVNQYKPEFTCAEHKNNDTDDMFELDPKTFRQAYSNETCHTKFYIRGNNSNSTRNIECTEFFYNLAENENSALTEFNFVCGDSWVNDLAITLFLLGVAIGSASGGFLSDKLGRRTVFLLFTALQFVFNFSFSLATGKTSYLLLSFFNGLPNIVNYAAAVLLGFETLPKKAHNLYYALLGINFAIGNMIAPVIACFVRDWRNYCRVLGCIGFLYLPYFWLVDESPLWLKATNKLKKFESLTESVRKFNGSSEKSTAKHVVTSEARRNKEVWKMWREILKHPAMIYRVVVAVFGWLLFDGIYKCMVSLIYHAITLNTNSLHGNRFVNCVIAAATEVVACSICYLATEKIEPKVVFVWSTLAAGFSVTASPFIAEYHGMGATVSTMVAKFCASTSFYVLYLHVPTIFPTSVRHSSVAVATAASRAAGLLTPLVMHGASDKVTSLLIGCLLVVSSMTYSRLPSTSKLPLPTTFDEAVNMNKKVQLKTEEEEKLNV